MPAGASGGGEAASSAGERLAAGISESEGPWTWAPAMACKSQMLLTNPEQGVLVLAGRMKRPAQLDNPLAG